MLYNFLRVVAKILFLIVYKVEVKGIENIPKKEGKYIICPNHIHEFDPVLVALYVKHDQISFLAKDSLFKNKFLSWFFTKINCIPVKRDGDDLKSIKTAIKRLKDNKVLGIFPEGTRNNSSEMLKPKAGLGMLAIKTKTKVLPVAISGSYKFRTKLTVNYGKLISLEEYYNDKSLTTEDYIEICEKEIYTKINELKEK